MSFVHSLLPLSNGEKNANRLDFDKVITIIWVVQGLLFWDTVQKQVLEVHVLGLSILRVRMSTFQFVAVLSNFLLACRRFGRRPTELNELERTHAGDKP